VSDAAKIAEAVGRAMFAADCASQAFGMILVETRPGAARMTMTVRKDMLNGHGTCHGGTIFALADSTFAFACNSHNVVTVAQHCSVTFLEPAREGDVLTADAIETHRGGRTGLTDVTITNQHGKLIALFRGHAYELKGTVAPGIAATR
jgi:acyl-CoA thioesterase